MKYLLSVIIMISMLFAVSSIAEAQVKWSQFPIATPGSNDTVVGLQNGNNVRFAAGSIAVINYLNNLSQNFPTYLQNLGTASTPLTGNETTYIIQNGVPKQTTVANIGGPYLYRVSVYGAKGDGVTDDTTAFTNALAACSATNGGIVQLDPLRYLINSANLTIPANCRLVGNGQQGPRNVNQNWTAAPYQILLNPTFTIKVGSGGASTSQGGAEIRGIIIRSTVLFTPSSLRDLLTMVNNFSGTAITNNGGASRILNTVVLGFAKCIYSSGNGQLYVNDFYGDCSVTGITVDNSHDTSIIENAQIAYYATINSNVSGGSTQVFSVSNIANNGSGLYRVSLSVPTPLQTGDTVWIFGSNVLVNNNRWTATVINSQTVDLQGSVFGGPTTTGNTTYGSTTVTSIANIANIAPGQTVTGTGIQGSTTVKAVWRSQNMIFLSAPATATNTGTSLTFADPTFSGSSPQLAITANARIGGIGFSFTSSENIECVNCATEASDTAFYFGTGAAWVQCINCGADSNTLGGGTISNNSFSTEDPGLLGVWFDSTSHDCRFTGYTTSMNALRNTSVGAAGHGNTFENVTSNPPNGPYATYAEISGSAPFIMTGNNETGVSSFFLADNTGPLILGDNNFVNAVTPYYQSLADLNNVSGAGTTFVSGTLYPSTPSDSNSNLIINGDMTIDQVGEGASGNCRNLQIDRWRCANNAGGTLTWQRVTDAPTGLVNSLKLTITSASTIGASNQVNLLHNIEGAPLIPLLWGTNNALPVVLDFWVKSSLTGTFSGVLTNSGQSVGYLFTYTIANAASWTKVSIVIPGEITAAITQTPNAIGLAIRFDLGSGSNLQTSSTGWWTSGGPFLELTGSTQVAVNSGATWQLTGVRLRQGTQTNATYTPRHYATELALAQRYYTKSFSAGTAPANNIGTGTGEALFQSITSTSGTAKSDTIRFPVPMYTSPTITFYNPAGTNSNCRDETAVGDGGAGTAVGTSSRGFQATCTVNGSGSTNDTYGVHWAADSGI